MKSRDKATVAVQTDPEMLIKEKKKVPAWSWMVLPHPL